MKSGIVEVGRKESGHVCTGVAGPQCIGVEQVNHSNQMDGGDETMQQTLRKEKEIEIKNWPPESKKIMLNKTKLMPFQNKLACKANCIQGGILQLLPIEKQDS